MKVRVCRLRRGRTARGCEGGRGWRRMARGRVPGDGTGSCAGRGCGARHGVVAAAWQHVWWNVSATALGAGDKNGRFSRGKRTTATTSRHPSLYTPDFGTLDPAPYILHPAPGTLHHASRTPRAPHVRTRHRRRGLCGGEATEATDAERTGPRACVRRVRAWRTSWASKARHPGGGGGLGGEG